MNCRPSSRDNMSRIRWCDALVSARLSASVTVVVSFTFMVALLAIPERSIAATAPAIMPAEPPAPMPATTPFNAPSAAASQTARATISTGRRLAALSIVAQNVAFYSDRFIICADGQVDRDARRRHQNRGRYLLDGFTSQSLRDRRQREAKHGPDRHSRCGVFRIFRFRPRLFRADHRRNPIDGRSLQGDYAHPLSRDARCPATRSSYLISCGRPRLSQRQARDDGGSA